jgi:ribosomal protein S18 acetylase RimI-like enzyme
VANQEYEQQIQIPGADEYRELRTLCGMSEKSHEAASQGLPNSLFATTIRDKQNLVAMGRVVGDGGCDYGIVDAAVHPDYQRQGLGHRVMLSIMSYLRDNAPESAYVALIADDHSPALYSKFGFEPTVPKSIGMAYRVRK